MNAQPERRRRSRPAKQSPSADAALEQAGLPDAASLQETLGNAATGRLLESGLRGAALPALPDSNAGRMMLGGDMLTTLQATMGNAFVQRLVAGPVQRKAAQPDEEQALRQVEAAQVGGEPLREDTRADMESTLGHDLSDVRVHTDVSADQLSKQLNARAFTTGRDIFFRSGAYDPESQTGKETLAHELTHVAQQAGEGIAPSRAISDPADPAEQEAEQVAHGLSSTPANGLQRGTALVHRQGPEDKEDQQGEATTGQPDGSAQRPGLAGAAAAAGGGAAATATASPPPTTIPGAPSAAAGASSGAAGAVQAGPQAGGAGSAVAGGAGAGAAGGAGGVAAIDPNAGAAGPSQAPGQTVAAGAGAGAGGGAGSGGGTSGGAGAAAGAAGAGAGAASAAGQPLGTQAVAGGAGAAGGGAAATGAGAPAGQVETGAGGAPGQEVGGGGGARGAGGAGNGAAGGAGGAGGGGTPGVTFPGAGAGASTGGNPVVPAPAQNAVEPVPQAGASIDWASVKNFFTDPNVIRTALEFTRPIPGWGIFTGMAADVMNTIQDANAVHGDTGLTGGMVVLRDGVMVFNNVLGQIAALDQTVQDAALASVEGAPAAAVTAELQEGVKWLKIVVDGIQITLDVIVIAGAKQHAAHATTKESREEWNNLLKGFEVNVLTDVISGIIDGVDIASAGTANAENIKNGANAAKTFANTARKWMPVVRNVILQLIGVWGGNAPLPVVTEPPIPTAGPAVQRLGDDNDAASTAGGVAKAAAAMAARSELAEIRDLYTFVDMGLTMQAETMKELMDNARERMTEMLGGQDPVKLFVSNMHLALDTMNNEVSSLLDLQVTATTLKERADGIRSYTDNALAAISAIRVPDIRLPTSGDGGLLDEAEKLVQEQIIDRIRTQIVGAVEGVKASANAPIESVRSEADDIAEFSVMLQESARDVVGMVQEKIAKFSAAIGSANNLEDLANVLIRQISELLGLGEGFTIDELISDWKSIGPLLDEADQALASWGSGGPLSAGGNEPGGAQTPVAAAAAPEPPPGE